MHPYKTLVVHKFYHSEHEAKNEFRELLTSELYSREINDTPILFSNIHVTLVNELRTSYGPAKYNVNLLNAIHIYPTRVRFYIFVQGL